MLVRARFAGEDPFHNNSAGGWFPFRGARFGDGEIDYAAEYGADQFTTDGQTVDSTASAETDTAVAEESIPTAEETESGDTSWWDQNSGKLLDLGGKLVTAGSDIGKAYLQQHGGSATVVTATSKGVGPTKVGAKVGPPMSSSMKMGLGLAAAAGLFFFLKK
jgi:hypothetical protein